MALTRGFISPREVHPNASAARFDWYSASLGDVDGQDVADTFAAVGFGHPVRCEGRHGFAVRTDFLAGRVRVASVSHGGCHDRVLVESSGEPAVQVSELVRRRWPDHRVTRVDSCMDWDSPTAWAELSGLALRVAREAGVKTQVAGDWLGGVDGRTLYVGGRTASTRLRVYEKGKQVPEAMRPDWVRCEVQYRPDRSLKGRTARLSPLEVWGASRWSRTLLEALTGLETAPLVGHRWSPPDDVRARDAVVRQYGAVLGRWAEELGGWSALGVVLGEEIGAMAPDTAVTG